MVHYHRDLHTLLRNFVSFADFYDPARPAVFQAGTLYLDSRSCDLCIRVDDPGAHSTLGALSRMCIAYCDCKRADGSAMKIAACFTQGDSDYLMVGRNGLFYDRQGRDWDATIVKIIENPISIRQAFFAPYKKFLRLIEEQVARFAAAKEAESVGQDGRGRQRDGRARHRRGARRPPRPRRSTSARWSASSPPSGSASAPWAPLFGGLVAGFIGLQPWWAKLVALAGILLGHLRPLGGHRLAQAPPAHAGAGARRQRLGHQRPGEGQPAARPRPHRPGASCRPAPSARSRILTRTRAPPAAGSSSGPWWCW